MEETDDVSMGESRPDSAGRRLGMEDFPLSFELICDDEISGAKEVSAILLSVVLLLFCNPDPTRLMGCSRVGPNPTRLGRGGLLKGSLWFVSMRCAGAKDGNANSLLLTL